MASLVRHPLHLQTPVTILFGENGSGKSTLLEAIAVCFGLNPEGDSKNLRFSTFSSEAYGGGSLHCQSHGESFFALLKNRFGGRGLYLLDESEAALSLLVIFRELVEADSQLIIATHSPILAIPARRFLNGQRPAAASLLMKTPNTI